MSGTFKFHSQVGEVVPFQAKYAFPSQMTKVQKQVVKLTPKTGGSYTSGSAPIQIEFPSDGYLNMLNSVLLFDVQITGVDASHLPTFPKQGAHSLFRRLRILYGSMVIEDIQEYSVLTRMLIECGAQPDYTRTTGTILDGTLGHGSIFYDKGANANDTGASSSVHGSANALTSGQVNLQSTRTFALNLLSGVMTCKKLIPLKWMASQLKLELTLAPDVEAIMADLSAAAVTKPAYHLTNVCFLAELVEFDSR